MRRTRAGILIAAVLTACGGAGGEDATGVTASEAEVTGPSAPADVDLVIEALERMPDELAGSPRIGFDGEARYGAEGQQPFGLEALEYDDVVGPNSDLDVEDVVAGQVAEPAPCAGDTTVCVRGGDGSGGHVTMWASTDGTLLFAAVAEDEATVRALEDAWNRALNEVS